MRPEIRCGIDILSLRRVQLLHKKYGAAFFQRIFTTREFDYCFACPRWLERAAGTFAAKEAVYKCLHAAWKGPWSWKNIELVQQGGAAPLVELTGAACETLGKRFHSFSVSISHCEDYAAASAVLLVWYPGRTCGESGELTADDVFGRVPGRPFDPPGAVAARANGLWSRRGVSGRDGRQT